MKGKTVRKIVVSLMVAGLFAPLTSFAETIETTAGIRFIDPSPVPHNDQTIDHGQEDPQSSNNQNQPGSHAAVTTSNNGLAQNMPNQNAVYPITKGTDSTGNSLLDRLAHAYPKTGSIEDNWLYLIAGIELLLILLLVITKRAKGEKTNEKNS